MASILHKGTSHRFEKINLASVSGKQDMKSLIEKIFRVTFWDYSDDPLSIGRYTSLKMSLVWGISSLFVIYILKPIIDKTVNHIPRVISYILITLFMIDCFLTFAPNLIK